MGKRVSLEYELLVGKDACHVSVLLPGALTVLSLGRRDGHMGRFFFFFFGFGVCLFL